MCNAWNHPPGCNCGWGGVWYGSSNSRGSWLFDKHARPRQLGRMKGTESELSGGFTVPNSKCPVCGASVYYYESPYGGRVFFDQLGPPWPKHPCTSSDDIGAKPVASSGWQNQKWRPLTHVSISRAGSHDHLYTLTGTCAGRRHQLCFSATEIVMAEVVRFRQSQPGTFDLSILDFNTITNEWIDWEGIAFANATLALTKAQSLSPTLIHRHSLPKRFQDNAKPTTVEPWPQCPDCQVPVKPGNLRRHIVKQHGYVPMGTMQRITGRLLIH